MSARSSTARLLRRILRKSGRDLVPYTVATHPVARRMHLLGRSGVNVVFDVGANAGIMEAAGFVLMSLEPEFTDPTTGQLPQVDGVFFRVDASRSDD